MAIRRSASLSVSPLVFFFSFLYLFIIISLPLLCYGVCVCVCVYFSHRPSHLWEEATRFLLLWRSVTKKEMNYASGLIVAEMIFNKATSFRSQLVFFFFFFSSFLCRLFRPCKTRQNPEWKRGRVGNGTNYLGCVTQTVIFVQPDVLHIWNKCSGR